MSDQILETTKTTKEELEDTIANMAEISKVSQNQISAQKEITRWKKEKEKAAKFLHGDISVIEEKLLKYDSLESLQKDLQSPGKLEEFFTDEETGEHFYFIDPSDTSKNNSEEEDRELKTNYLLFLKQSQLSNDEIEEALKQFEKDKEELEKELHTTTSEFVYQYLDYVKELRATTLDTEENKKLINELDYIESGFTFQKIMETYDEIPSIVKNTLKDMRNPEKIQSIGKKYHTTLNNAGSYASLIVFISNSPDTSFEEMYLPPDKYRAGYENLFMFSLIRYFSMSYWNADVVRMHSVIITTLQRFISNEMPEDMKEQYVNNIAAYLEKIYPENG